MCESATEVESERVASAATVAALAEAGECGLDGAERCEVAAAGLDLAAARVRSIWADDDRVPA